MDLVADLKFDHFSDIGIQSPRDPQASVSQSQQDVEKQLRKSCQNNLKRLGLVMQMFANEQRGERYPRPNRLRIELSDIYPEYLTDTQVLMCPADDALPANNLPSDHKPSWHLAHSRYWYLGHAVNDEEQALAYIDAYRNVVLEGDGNLDVDFEIETLSQSGIFRTRVGIERFFITDINDPNAGAKERSKIPVLIEFTDKHGSQGGNVLFLDGHVEYITYPGKFPMTPAVISGLQSLDALGAERDAHPSDPERADAAGDGVEHTTREAMFKGTYTLDFINSHDISYFLDRLAEPEPDSHRFAALWAAQFKAANAQARERGEIVDMALTIAEDASKSHQERFQCCYLASSFEITSTIPRLAAILRSGTNNPLRSVAAYALGHFESKDAEEELEKALLAESDELVRTSIERAMSGEFPRPRIWEPGILPRR